MTQSQAERLVAASHGNLCAQFTNLADGSIKTLPDLSPPTQHKRPSSAAAAVVTAMLGIGVSAGAAAPPRNPGAKTQSALRKESSTASRTAISGGLGATLSGVVSDEDGIQVAGAMVTVTNQETGAGLTTKTLGNGFFQFDGLAAGSYSITAAAGGYSVKSFNGIELSEGQNHLTDVV